MLPTIVAPAPFTTENSEVLPLPLSSVAEALKNGAPGCGVYVKLKVAWPVESVVTRVWPR